MGCGLDLYPHFLHGRELSWEEFWYNLCLIHGLMPQDIPTTCNDCGKNRSIDHAISCPNGGIFLARHEDAAKDWGDLRSQALTPSDISYDDQISIRTVQE